MDRRQYHLHNGQKGAALAVRVTPRASRNEIVEVLSDGTVKIRLTAPPVEGQANQALVNFLSDVLDIAPSRLEIVAGATGRDKLVSILDMEADEVHQKILTHLG
jgi:uncharacterized protein (TIGR00251 family)